MQLPFHNFDRPSTLRLLVAKNDSGRHATGSAQTRFSLENRPDTVFQQSLPGAEVQLDTTRLDVLVKVPGSHTPLRPHLTIMVDVATRSLLAYTFRLGAAKGIDHIALIAQALTPLDNLPDRTKLREVVQLRNPGRRLLSPERLAELARHRPFIFPRSLTIDNEKDFKSNAVSAAAEAFGMNIVFSPPRTPTAKSIVESTFGAIETMFTQHLPGYVSRSTEFRGLDVEKRADLLDIYAVQELFHDWVLNVWQNHPRHQLRDPLHPSAKYSPNQMAASAGGVASTVRLPLTREEYIALLPKARRSLRSTGVHLRNHRYDSPLLHPLRGAVQSVDVYFDPYNPAMVWAQAPDGSLIECHIGDWDSMNNPFFAEFQPDGTDLPEADPIADPRAEAALIGSTLSGVHLHALPQVARELDPQPTTFFDSDDNDADELTEFDPKGN